MPWHLLHPAAVHFPIALLMTGLAAAVLGLEDGADKLLWLGTASVWAAAGLGYLAKWKAPHVPAAWEVLADHESMGYWTVGLFTALSVWRWRWKPGRRALVAGWLVAAGLLSATAYHGGELVYKFGMGVMRE